jgi:hypothetical protein
MVHHEVSWLGWETRMPGGQNAGKLKAESSRLKDKKWNGTARPESLSYLLQSVEKMDHKN